MATILTPKLTEKSVKICQKMKKFDFFTAYTAACWPARLGLNKLKLVIFVSTA